MEEMEPVQEESPLSQICKEIQAAKDRLTVSENVKSEDLPPQPQDVNEAVIQQQDEFMRELEKSGFAGMSAEEVTLAAMNAELEPVLLRIPDAAQRVSLHVCILFRYLQQVSTGSTAQKFLSVFNAVKIQGGGADLVPNRSSGQNF